MCWVLVLSLCNVNTRTCPPEGALVWVLTLPMRNTSGGFTAFKQRFSRSLLNQLLHHKLYVKAEKCEFHKDTITFLGYVISQRGVEMDAGKVKAAAEWPKPTMIKELQRFLGFSNFKKNYSCVTGPLTSLLQGKPQAQTAFNKLKASFTTAPILKHPDPSKPRWMPPVME